MTRQLFTRIVMCACAIAACTGSAEATVSFNMASYLSGHFDMRGITVGDFNGDGVPDLVVVNSETNEFLYWQGNGDGTFGPFVTTSMAGATSLLPEAIVAADFNGDGKLDIAISHPYLSPTMAFGGNVITVHLGDGAGHFGDGIIITTGTTPTSLAIGDFNGDGIPDLAVGALGDRAVWIHLGNGDGTFRDPTQFPANTLSGGTAMDIATADVNNDGHLDVVAEDSGQVITLLGDGVGGFTPLPAVNVRSEFAQIALGDINGDGKIDLVAASSEFDSTDIDVFLGVGDGTFAFQQEKHVSGPGSAITMADFDTDGTLDLALGRSVLVTQQDFISVFTGDGMGNFPAEFDFGFVGDTIPSYRMVAGDFNRDGRPDLAITGGPPREFITVLINTSPRGCDDSLDLTYNGGTLNLSFTLKSAQPAIWSTWLAFPNNVINLWSLPVPRVVPAVNFNVPIPGFPMIGNVGVLTTLSNSTFGLVCADFQIVDTGGVGATPQQLKDQIMKNGIIGSLP